MTFLIPKKSIIAIISFVAVGSVVFAYLFVFSSPKVGEPVLSIDQVQPNFNNNSGTMYEGSTSSAIVNTKELIQNNVAATSTELSYLPDSCNSGPRYESTYVNFSKTESYLRRVSNLPSGWQLLLNCTPQNGVYYWELHNKELKKVFKISKANFWGQYVVVDYLYLGQKEDPVFVLQKCYDSCSELFFLNKSELQSITERQAITAGKELFSDQEMIIFSEENHQSLTLFTDTKIYEYDYLNASLKQLKSLEKDNYYGYWEVGAGGNYFAYEVSKIFDFTYKVLICSQKDGDVIVDKKEHCKEKIISLSQSNTNIVQ